MEAPAPKQHHAPLIRIATTLLVLLALLGLGGLQTSRQPPEWQLAQQHQGERWFRIELADEPVGYFHTTAGFDDRGRWQYASHTHLLMRPGEVLDISKRLTFAARSPFPLVAAEQSVRQGAETVDEVLVERSDGAMLATLHDGPQQELPWQYELADYLAVELWLQRDSPSEGSRTRVRTLDLRQLALIPRTYEVEQTAPWRIRYEAPLGPTRIELDGSLQPTYLHATDLFTFRRATFADALGRFNPALRTAYSVPTDQPLNRTDQIGALTVELPGIATLTGRPGSAPTLEATTRSTSAYPTDAEEIRALRAETSRLTPRELLSWVHQRLTYRADSRNVHVLKALEQGYGECTEFADLFTTLARAAGYPAHTIYGIASNGGEAPGFALHAWNAIYLEGRWQSVDPTWNQWPADATHLAMTDEELARLRWLHRDQSVRALVKDVRYSDGG